MKHNVGKGDRYLRIVVGLAVIAAGFYWQTWWGAVGLLPLITGFMKRCPSYMPFGISSCKCDSDSEASSGTKCCS
jgi:hypothetical protein